MEFFRSDYLARVIYTLVTLTLFTSHATACELATEEQTEMILKASKHFFESTEENTTVSEALQVYGSLGSVEFLDCDHSLVFRHTPGSVDQSTTVTGEVLELVIPKETGQLKLVVIGGIEISSEDFFSSSF